MCIEMSPGIIQPYMFYCAHERVNMNVLSLRLHFSICFKRINSHKKLLKRDLIDNKWCKW